MKKIYSLIKNCCIVHCFIGGLIPNAPLIGHIQFINIDFNYPSRKDIDVLKRLSLEIVPGSTVAVVGASGSGKSTLAALLLRLYDPTGGIVYVDSQDIRTLNPFWLRKHIGTVSQVN